MAKNGKTKSVLNNFMTANNIFEIRFEMRFDNIATDELHTGRSSRIGTTAAISGHQGLEDAGTPSQKKIRKDYLFLSLALQRKC